MEMRRLHTLRRSQTRRGGRPSHHLRFSILIGILMFGQMLSKRNNKRGRDYVRKDDVVLIFLHKKQVPR